eukprot:scaffold5016_cov118-Isochrysis_galbana.AAC.1
MELVTYCMALPEKHRATYANSSASGSACSRSLRWKRVALQRKHRPLRECAHNRVPHHDYEPQVGGAGGRPLDVGEGGRRAHVVGRRVDGRKVELVRLDPRHGGVEPDRPHQAVLLPQEIVPPTLPALGLGGDRGAAARVVPAGRQVRVVRVRAEGLHTLKLHRVGCELRRPPAARLSVDRREHLQWQLRAVEASETLLEQLGEAAAVEEELLPGGAPAQHVARDPGQQVAPLAAALPGPLARLEVALLQRAHRLRLEGCVDAVEQPGCGRLREPRDEQGRQDRLRLMRPT